MIVRTQIRRTSRNGLVVACLLVIIGGALLYAGPGESYPGFVPIGLIVVGGVLGLLVVAGMIWPRWNLILRRLSAFGPPDQVAAEIDAELAQTDMVLTFGQPVRPFRISRTDKFPILVTPSWLLQFGELGLRVARLNDITWYYKKIDTIRYNLGFKDRWYSVVVHKSNGQQEECHQAEAEVDRLIKELMILLPGVRCGYPC